MEFEIRNDVEHCVDVNGQPAFRYTGPRYLLCGEEIGAAEALPIYLQLLIIAALGDLKELVIGPRVCS